MNTFKIHFIRTISIRNAGDMACGPYLYFEEFTKNFICSYHDVRNIDYNDIASDDLVIIGGSGLIDVSDEIVYAINLVLEKCKNVIAWSVGHNKHFGCDIKDKIHYEKFILISVRDYNYPGQNYLPCVTCMMPYFDKKYTIKRRIGVIEHTNYPIREFPYERISNSCALENIIDFIGTSEIIITNSYHCCYWSVLMRKKVILYNTFSEKFNYMKYNVPHYSGCIENDIISASVYQDELAECRKANQIFAKEVLQIAYKLKENMEKTVNYEYEIRKIFVELFTIKLCGKRCAIYGGGLNTLYLEEFFGNQSNVLCVTGKEKKYEFTVPFVPFNEIKKMDVDTLIISAYASREEIKNQLLHQNQYEIIDIYDVLESKDIFLEKDFFRYYSRVIISD